MSRRRGDCRRLADPGLDNACTNWQLILHTETAYLACPRSISTDIARPESSTVATDPIPFNRPYTTGKELDNIAQAQRSCICPATAASRCVAIAGSSSRPAAPRLS